MSIKYPWLPEAIASPLRRARNSAAFRYRAWRAKPKRKTIEEQTAAELAQLKAVRETEKEYLFRLRSDLEYALRACYHLPQAADVLRWIYDNDNYRSRETRPAYNSKIARPVAELDAIIHRYIKEAQHGL